MNWRILPLLVIVAALAAIGTLAYTANQTAPAKPDSKPDNMIVMSDGTRVPVIPGVPVTLNRVESQSDQGGTVRKDQQGSATGAGLTSDSQDAVLGFKASAPILSFEAIRAEAGDIDIKATYTGKKPLSWIAWLGAAFLVASAISFCFSVVPKKVPVTLLLFGLGLSAAALMPSLFVAIVAIGAIGFGGYFVWLAIKHHSANTAATTMAKAIENAPEEAAAAVKEEVQGFALKGTPERAAVNSVLKKIGLGPA